MKTLLLFLALAASALAAVPTSTTLQSSISGADQKLVLLSTAGLNIFDTLYMDSEAMRVRTINGIVVTVDRSILGTRATPHGSGAVVYMGNQALFTSVTPQGGCSTVNDVNTLIDVKTGFQWACSAGTWATSSGGSGASLPAQSGQAGNVLGTDGTIATWTPPLSMTSSINITQAPYYASGFRFQATTTLAVKPGDTTLTVSSIAGFSVNQIARVQYAGTSNGQYYTGTITGIAGNVLTVSPAIGNIQGATTTSGTTSSGATTVTIADPTFYSGTGYQPVVIIGAGASGGNYVGQIVSIAGSVLTVTPATGTTISTGAAVQHIIPIANVYTLGTTTTVGSTPSGSTILAVAQPASYLAHHGILITGAGAGGVNYIGTIVAILGSTLLVTPATATTVAGGTNVQHDDSAAIQSAMNTATAYSGVSIYFPDGWYQVNGPRQRTGIDNSILVVPAITYDGITPPVLVSMYGTSKPPSLGTLGGVIISTEATSGSLLAGSTDSTENFPQITRVMLHLQNITLRAYTNPSVAMVNGLNVSSIYLDSVNIDTGVSLFCGTTQCGAPSSTLGFAVIGGKQSTDLTYINNVYVEGYYTGMTATEHLVMVYGDFLRTNKTLVFGASSVAHANTIGHMVSAVCTDVLSGTSPATTGTIVVEQCTNLVNDSANALHGQINYSVTGGGGTVIGGANLGLYDLRNGPLDGRLLGPYRNWAPSNILGIVPDPLVGKSLSGQVLTMTPGANHANAGGGLEESVDIPIFTGHTVSARVLDVLAGNSGLQQYFIVGTGTAVNVFGFLLLGDGTLKCITTSVSTVASTTFSATSHLYWRIRDGGSSVLYAETSPDNSTWTELGHATVGWSYASAAKVAFMVYETSATLYPGYARFDRFTVQ